MSRKNKAVAADKVNRRELLAISSVAFTVGVLGITSTDSVNAAMNAQGGIGSWAVTGDSVWGTPCRLDSNRKERGFVVIIETRAPSGITPYDVSLFLQEKRGDSWEYVMPRIDSDGNPTEMARAYTSALGPIVDYTIVTEDSASVSLFIPNSACPFADESVELGIMRFMLRVFPWNETQNRFILDPSFDRFFGEAKHMRFGPNKIILSNRHSKGLYREFGTHQLRD